MQEQNIKILVRIYRYDELSTEFQKLADEARRQCSMAYAPYSQFQVGAAALLENGITAGGNNQENAAYPSGLCAERTAIFHANSQYPQTPVKAIAIAAFTQGKFLQTPISPCGACRQVLLESENRFGKNIRVLLCGAEEYFLFDSAAELLPFNFSKKQLQE